MSQNQVNYQGIKEQASFTSTLSQITPPSGTAASTGRGGSATKSQQLLKPLKRLFRLKSRQVPSVATVAATNTYMNGSLQQEPQPQAQNGSHRPAQDHLMAKPQVYVVGSPNPKSPFLRIAHISDTCDLSEGDCSSAIFEADVLVHSGNLCSYQFRKHFFKDAEFANQVKTINDFFAGMPHKYKIFVPGPNEIFFDSEETERVQALLPNCIYLQDTECLIEGVKFYGVPWSPSRRGAVGRGFGKSVAELKTVWSNVPDNVDVLISHSVPTNSLYDDLVSRLKPKMFMYGSRMQRSSRTDQVEENCVKFKDNVIFSNGHAGNACKRGIFDFYADDQTPRVTSLPEVPPDVASEALRSLAAQRNRPSILRCILS